MSPHRSICCILPPHLLRAIAQHSGSPPLRHKALATLTTDETLRALRAQLQRRVLGTGRRPRIALTAGKKRRSIYTAGNEPVLPGLLVRSEGSEPTGDLAVDEAYEALGATFDFFWEEYGRNSIDDEGMTIEATVHFGRDYDNAFWDGRRLVFGDGDQDLFHRFTIALDITGHELSHGVVDDEAQLTYFRQAGALNESLADVFGVLVKQRRLRQTAQEADWLVGAGLFTANVQGRALRSLKEPGTAYDDPVLGKDPQPGHMRGFVQTLEDNGGVHINSGIPNRAFALTALALGGHAWERAGRVWYEALRDPALRPDADFGAFARITLVAAGRLFGEGKDVQRAVREGWTEVGVPLDRSGTG